MSAAQTPQEPAPSALGARSAGSRAQTPAQTPAKRPPSDPLEATERVHLGASIPVDQKAVSLRQGAAQPAWHPAQHEARSNRRWLVGGAALVVVVLLGAALLSGGPWGGAEQGAEGGAPLLRGDEAAAQDDPLALAERALQEGDWERAIAQAELVPASDGRAREKAQGVKRQAERQRKARSTYERAQAALNAGAWADALEQLKLLPKDELPSGYAARAKREGLEERAKKGLQIQTLLLQARDHQKRGKLPAARAAVQRALQLDPAHKEALALAELLGPAAP